MKNIHLKTIIPQKREKGGKRFLEGELRRYWNAVNNFD